MHIVNFAIKDAKKRKNIKIRLPYPISTAYDITERTEHRKIITDSERVEMLSIQINIMAMLLSKFDFLPIYRADLAGSRTLSFVGNVLT